MIRVSLASVCFMVIALAGGMALATPKLGDDCKACHNSNVYLPPAHPNVTNMTSAVCKTCHLGTMDQDQARINSQIQQQDREQDREQQRDQDQTRRQVRLGGDPGANPLGIRSAARNVDPGKEIELYLDRESRTETETGEGHGDDDKFSHERHYSETKMAEDANKWSYRFLLGYLYSSDINLHQSGSNLGAGGGHGEGGGGGHGEGGGGGHDPDAEYDDDGDEGDGSYLRLGARADYTSYIGNDQTLTYSFALNRDAFTGLEQIRYIGRARLEWKRKLDDGSFKISPYLQRSLYDRADDEDKAFWALGLNANRHLSVSPTATLSFTFRYKQRLYDGEDAARRADLRLGTVYQDALGEWGQYRLGIGLSARNNPKHEDKRYIEQILTAGFGGTLANGAFGWLSGELGRRDYRAVDRTAGYTRQDSYIGLGASYVDKRLTVLGSVPQLSCQTEWTGSNIDDYDETSTYCSVLFERRF